jgi:nicotinamidase-related amidase
MKQTSSRKEDVAVLTIIDMQPRFPSSQNTDTVAAVLRLIAKAIERNWPVLLIEFYAHGPTDNRISAALRNYSGCIREFKYDDDGSEKIWEACVEHELPGSRFVICGVNTHACIKKTVFGMARLMPDSAIEVIQDACNCDTGWSWQDFFLPNKNVVLRRTCPN